MAQKIKKFSKAFSEKLAGTEITGACTYTEVRYMAENGRYLYMPVFPVYAYDSRLPNIASRDLSIEEIDAILLYYKNKGYNLEAAQAEVEKEKDRRYYTVGGYFTNYLFEYVHTDVMDRDVNITIGGVDNVQYDKNTVFNTSGINYGQAPYLLRRAFFGVGKDAEKGEPWGFAGNKKMWQNWRKGDKIRWKPKDNYLTSGQNKRDFYFLDMTIGRAAKSHQLTNAEDRAALNKYFGKEADLWEKNYTPFDKNHLVKVEVEGYSGAPKWAKKIPFRIYNKLSAPGHGVATGNYITSSKKGGCFIEISPIWNEPNGFLEFSKLFRTNKNLPKTVWVKIGGVDIDGKHFKNVEEFLNVPITADAELKPTNQKSKLFSLLLLLAGSFLQK